MQKQYQAISQIQEQHCQIYLSERDRNREGEEEGEEERMQHLGEGGGDVLAEGLQAGLHPLEAARDGHDLLHVLCEDMRQGEGRGK